MTKIMLVEDDKSLREIYSIRLTAEGYEVVSAGDGEEALALAVQERPTLILSDVMMPKISGFDMLDILRSTPETQGTKVIMMTALSSDDQRSRGESLGADKYLVKSQVGIEDVVNAVHEVLGDKNAQPVAAEAVAQPAVAEATVQPVAPVMPVEAPAVEPMTQPVAPVEPVMQPVVPAEPVMPAEPSMQPAAPITPVEPVMQPVMPAEPSMQPVMPADLAMQPTMPATPESPATPAEAAVPEGDLAGLGAEMERLLAEAENETNQLGGGNPVGPATPAQ